MEGGGGGTVAAAAAAAEKILFFLFFAKCQRVGRRSSGGGEGVWSQSTYSEEVCLPFGHFVLELASHTEDSLAFKSASHQADGREKNLHTHPELLI